MANNKLNLLEGQDLTAEPGTTEGLTKWPPKPPAERIAERQVSGYGKYFTPPAPLPYKTVDRDGLPINSFAGDATTNSLRVYWKSGVGEAAPDLPGKDYFGVRGLDSLGIIGHEVTIAGGPGGFTPKVINILGAQLWAEFTGLPKNPKPGLAAGTPFLITVKARGLGGLGPASAAIPAYTGSVAGKDDPVTAPVAPPAMFQLGGPLPTVLNPAGVLVLEWRWVFGADGYQIFNNESKATAVPMDPARPGLMVGDFQLGADIPQVTVFDPRNDLRKITFGYAPAAAAGTPFCFKIRTFKTYDYGGGVIMKAFSQFTPVVRGVFSAK